MRSHLYKQRLGNWVHGTSIASRDLAWKLTEPSLLGSTLVDCGITHKDPGCHGLADPLPPIRRVLAPGQRVSLLPYGLGSRLELFKTHAPCITGCSIPGAQIRELQVFRILSALLNAVQMKTEERLRYPRLPQYNRRNPMLATSTIHDLQERAQLSQGSRRHTATFHWIRNALDRTCPR